MNSKKSKDELPGSGMKLIRGGVERPSFDGLCACSDILGVMSGAASGCGCACSNHISNPDPFGLHSKTLQAAMPID